MGRIDERMLEDNEPLVPHSYLREMVSELRYLHIFTTKQQRPVVVPVLCVFVAAAF